MAALSINHSNGRAVTQPHLPWSSGDDFRLSLIPISAGDRGSIPRGRDIFLHFVSLSVDLTYPDIAQNYLIPMVVENGRRIRHEDSDWSLALKCSAAPYIQTGPDISTRPAGPMARRLTTNQEIAGSIPASVNLFVSQAFYLFALLSMWLKW
ncbi:hypothetical protein N7447_005011 [Penicillium robsamsonii]|uniref:uncharacterized protein n=1 Tax=Penicillium robsamsonii TaxID=1792511 RepID=UPI002549B6AA|nr:uncharacterized protein N7447_005011 [Penicillium robsamsonii]KAJ5822671.1 hypothetical protein N7447_005011 [Penicillium robsamsonii]